MLTHLFVSLNTAAHRHQMVGILDGESLGSPRLHVTGCAVMTMRATGIRREEQPLHPPTQPPSWRDLHTIWKSFAMRRQPRQRAATPRRPIAARSKTALF